MNLLETDGLVAKAKQIRLYNLELLRLAGGQGSHVGGAMSSAEIFVALYGNALRYKKSDMLWSGRDRLILSKGHCAVGLYCALCTFGIISEKELYSYNENGGDYLMHCVKNNAKGIEISSGSLGLGLGYAAGMAIGLRKKGSDSHVYVLMGDGECDEGSVWEAACAIPYYGLTNITLIIDRNMLQNDGRVENIMDTLDLAAKLSAFGWDAVDVDGHDVAALCDAMTPDPAAAKPRAVIAHTVKGKGVSFMENNYKFHHASITEEQYKEAVKEITGEAGE